MILPDVCTQHSSEYPALTSALNLLDEVFDLQARSQWLRRGLINRLLGMLFYFRFFSCFSSSINSARKKNSFKCTI